MRGLFRVTFCFVLWLQGGAVVLSHHMTRFFLFQLDDLSCLQDYITKLYMCSEDIDNIVKTVLDIIGSHTCVNIRWSAVIGKLSIVMWCDKS